MPPDSFVAAKEECPISSVVMGKQHGAADVSSELVQMKLIDPGDRVFGVECAVAKEFPSRSVKIICS